MTVFAQYFPIFFNRYTFPKSFEKKLKYLEVYILTATTAIQCYLP